jgi:hypothetical protein
MKFAGHQNRGMEAHGRVLAPGEGYQERDARMSVLDPAVVAVWVVQRRFEEQALMETRSAEIEAGLVHESYAAEIIRLKGQR